ncbi:PREDICTED: high mobility group protein D [Rhagoletis zephyria]|uniref:high mobility group protein D n=1 Tax=Rhagoletis zephyria TaxID=28612 RepID=UPI0008118D02|nr:PREDICTED: high mobility group protein D [Rhagoletis zephyria]XP_017466804.1 PREDICTED: high mobility group protein D [Rhagoletis zephyria]
MSDKPKRPLSAYMIWLNSARDQIKRENPGIKVTEVAKRGGELWRAMKDKSEWEAKAAKAKEDYEEAVKDFEANGGSSANGSTKKRGKAVKKPAKKSKKADSDDEDEDEESE